MTERILLIEDDAALGAQIVLHLGEAGFEVTWVKDGYEAARADVASFALVLLDLMLPGTYGLDLLKRFRARSDVPVLIVSARDHTADKVRGLRLGADDYVTKPFWPEELLARVQARLRRPTITRSDRRRVGPVTLDLDARTVETDQGPVTLTPVELSILEVLTRRPNAAVTRMSLVEEALGRDADPTSRSLDVHVSRLRSKLGEAGACIETVWGIGYRFCPTPTESVG